MKSKKLYLAATALLALVLFLFQFTATAQQLRGNGNVRTQDRKVSSFSGIDVGGGFAVELTQGNAESVRLEAEDNLLDNIKTEVKNGVLHIYSNKSMSTSKGLKAYITVKTLRSLTLSGGVKLTGNSTFRTNELNMDLSGASKVMLALNAQKLSADMIGASKVDLTGAVGSMDLDVSGASKLEAANLAAKRAKVVASGASKVKVYAKEILDIDASGASVVYYKGSPNLTSEASAAAKVSKM